ncbi:HAD-IB family hydrolase [Aestuariirhabdus sp. Z084]|uniref:HAD family hydrolase n=1 Tax=Aestuariirhabdus haliotis TaxID=2918751 RepID=UPI00201B3E79|nr:HAD-IB family hydrolase [Aestuariirhabdus haliotis]MCL6416938.1 HAD-IB family hydrolase [Aestuariirhabdus haliotis]MCL6420959.1 HAD-IB family hydrolase [Aestuariirhabdus haliotis]
MALRIFDLDETLTSCDTSSLFCQYLVETGVATDPAFYREEQRLMALYAQQKMSIDDYVSHQMQPLLGLSADEVEQLTQRFVTDRVESRIYPQARQILAELGAAGHRLVVVSATVSFIVREVARRLGIADVLAIDLVLNKNGRYTGVIQGTPTYREGKVSRLRVWLEQEKESLHDAAFYSDSMNDLPLLECVDQPVATNPCAQLALIAEARNWPQLHWKDQALG